VIYLPTLNLTDATRTYVHDGVYLPANVYDGTAAWIDQAERKRQGISR
jgi:hypothetical protein